MSCANCPVEAGEFCLALYGDPVYAWMCRDATAEPSQMNEHIVAVCRVTLEMRANPSEQEQVQGPGITRMVVNFAEAMAHHAAAGFPKASQEAQDERLTICRENRCGYYGEGDRCLHSGCGCYLPMKVWLADQSCPLPEPLWGPVEGSK